MEKVGREGSITVEDGKKLTHEIEYIEGMNLDQGFISPYFITNTRNMKCEFDDCAVLVTDEKISRP
jgi:chaperonin GroEL